MQRCDHSTRLLGLAIALIVGLLLVFAGRPAPLSAESPPLVATQTAAGSHAAAGDVACVLCHSDTEAVVTLPSGESFPARVDTAVLAQSVHGAGAENPLQCVDCHQTINDYQYPHAPVSAETLRDYSIDGAMACERCHVQPHLTSHPGPESDNPVTCTDCHSSHDVAAVDQWRTGAATDTCVTCHVERDVTQQDRDTLTRIIQGGLFTNRIDNDYCLACHSRPNQQITFANGDTKSITIDPSAIANSVHGIENEYGSLNCTDCHERAPYPHPELEATSLREYSLNRYTVCADCHTDQYDRSLDSVHGAALTDGQAEAAVCTDCHGAHDVPHPNIPRARISFTCEKCHSTVFTEYRDSVHGDALLTESNPDVPTCIECHGVHNIGDPTTNLFRIRSPQLCATCHNDAELMAKYDISTDVFDTYVADFHGTTVTLFEHQDPNAETNKAVCYDCHGVHDIKATDDPEAGIKANLLATCQECHPNATANFPDSWTSHFRPSLQHNPLVYLVNLFYQIVIPVTLAFFGVLVLSDVYRRVRVRVRK